MHEDWRPAAGREALVRRAALLARTRAVFAERGGLEVETPLLVSAPVTEVHIASARVTLEPGAPEFYLSTSPEHAMKRLLAAGCGDIYQICRAVRGFEVSALHNPEFTLVEWYRLGFSLEQLMDEVAALVRTLLDAAPQAERAAGTRAARAVEHLSYRDAFLEAFGLDPLSAPLAALEAAARTWGYAARGSAAGQICRDELLDFLVAVRLGPRLGRGRLTFLHGYPASQASLARLDPRDPRTALRFELYCEGIELANGFDELASAQELRARLGRDLERRKALGLPELGVDERLLAALAAGLPSCAGVALGFDRVLMLALGAQRLGEVLAFPADRA